MTTESNSRLGRFFDEIEETSIAACLGLMTLITFANVVARYIFNSNILWALEATVFLFAWLVLMGASYGVKKQFHIGVDMVINLLSPATRKLFAIAAVLCCLFFSITLLIGSWEYWSPFIGKRAFLETEDIPMPDALQFLSAWLNEGEKYEKLPRFIPYLALPLGMALLTFRFLQLAWKVGTGQVDTIIANHEVEEALEQVEKQRDDSKYDDNKRDDNTTSYTDMGDLLDTDVSNIKQPREEQ